MSIFATPRAAVRPAVRSCVRSITGAGGGLWSIAASYGDSTAQGMGDDGSSGNQARAGVIGWLQNMVKNAVLVSLDSGGGSYAGSGESAESLYSSTLPDLLAADPLPSFTVNQMGTNGLQTAFDSEGTVNAAAADIYGWIEQTCLDQKAAGITPIQCTILPRAAAADSTDARDVLAAVNVLIRDGIASTGAILADIAPIFRGGATDADDANTLLFSDFIHPHAGGRSLIAEFVLAIPAVASRINNEWPVPDTALTENHLLTGDSAGKATGWSVFVNGGHTVTPTKVAGDVQQIAVSGSTGPGITSNYTRLSDYIEVTNQEFDGVSIRGFAKVMSSDWEFWHSTIQVSVSGDGISSKNVYSVGPVGSSEIAKITSQGAEIADAYYTSAEQNVPVSTPGQKRRITITLTLYGNGTVQVPQFGAYSSANIYPV